MLKVYFELLINSIPLHSKRHYFYAVMGVTFKSTDYYYYNFKMSDAAQSNSYLVIKSTYWVSEWANKLMTTKLLRYQDEPTAPKNLSIQL